MRKILFITCILLVSQNLTAQPLTYQTNLRHEARYLKHDNGTIEPVIYFIDKKEYFSCKGPVSPKNKLNPHDSWVPGPCKCVDKDGKEIIISPSYTALISRSEAESLMRNTDRTEVSRVGGNIRLGKGDLHEEIIAPAGDAIIAYQDNYTRYNYLKYDHNLPATPIYAATGAAYTNIQFEFDSSVLKNSSYPALDATAADMRLNSSTITLAGYSSSEGSAAHSMRLSKDRANSVKTYLVNSGVDAKRIKVKAFGETHPIADNSTEEGRVKNRRVEFHR